MPTLYQKKCSRGFSLPELLSGIVVAGVIITAGLQLSSTIKRTSRDRQTSTTIATQTDVVLDQIVDEISQSKRIFANISDHRTAHPNCLIGSGEFFLSFELTPQAIGLSDYDNTRPTDKNRTIAETNQILCPVVIGIRRSESSEPGPYTVYRYGPALNNDGYYIRDLMRSATLLDRVAKSVHGSKRDCPLNWTKKELYGLEACVDKYRKTAHISFTSQVSKESPEKVIKRSKSGTALFGAKAPTFFSQNIICDGTVFLIDVSGSMAWGNNRMAIAKRELLSAVEGCMDIDRINVISFSHVITKFRNSNQLHALNPINRNAINAFISGFNAWGGTYPWSAVDETIQNNAVKRLVVLTDGITDTEGRCFFDGRYKKYADCYNQYNMIRRPGSMMTINSVGLDTYCSIWLGELSAKNGGDCIEANS